MYQTAPLYLPRRLAISIARTKMKNSIDPVVGGLDTETYEGEPLTYQLHCEAEPRLTKIEFVDATNVTRKFLAHLDRNCKSPYYRLRSEEHTSELQSRPHLVCRLLLEKKKKTHQ